MPGQQAAGRRARRLNQGDHGRLDPREKQPAAVRTDAAPLRPALAAGRGMPARAAEPLIMVPPQDAKRIAERGRLLRVERGEHGPDVDRIGRPGQPQGFGPLQP